MITEDVLNDGWEVLDRLSRQEYDASLGAVLGQFDDTLMFKQLGRLLAVSIKVPFAQPFPYEPELASNWAKSRQCWEIHRPPSKEQIRDHQYQYDLLESVALEWNRPVECVAEYNIFMSLCKKLRPVICGQQKALAVADKIAKELQRQGEPVAMVTPNQLIGAAAVAIATYLGESVSVLADSGALTTGVTLFVLCLGQQRLCRFLADFERSYDDSKDCFATHSFPICGSLETRDGTPCRALVRVEGTRCYRHA